MKQLLLLGAGLLLSSMRNKKAHPPLDKSWPLDVRQGFKNGQNIPGTRVLLNNKEVKCAAVSIETGHALVYKTDATGKLITPLQLEVKTGKVELRT